MRNREKVIHEFRNWCEAMADECPVICLHVLDLLEEQEPVKVKDCADIVDGIQVGYCPKCDRKIVWNPEKEKTVAFCKYCGQAVEWNA